MQLNTYVMFAGTCDAAFKLYEELLGGKTTMRMIYADSPMVEQTAPEWRDKVMHATMSVGDTVLMGMDAAPAHYQEPKGFYVSLGVAEEADADHIFQAMAVDGKVHMPIQKTFWSPRFGMLVDRFGIPWMINCTKML
jgi:PhnB protein